MVYCIHEEKDGYCKKTNGKCILDNPKTVDDYSKCPKPKRVGKDYDDMTPGEKSFFKSRENERYIREFGLKYKALESKHDSLLKRMDEFDYEFHRKVLTDSAAYTALHERLCIIENIKSIWWRFLQLIMRRYKK